MQVPAAAGNALYHARAPREDLITYLTKLAAQGDAVRVAIGPVTVILLNHPDLIREVLVSQAQAFHKPSNVKRNVRMIVGTNLFASDGDTWRALRKAIQPAFHTQRITHYLDIMNAMTREMVAGWATGQTVPIPQAMMDLTMGITTKALFDVDLRGHDAGNDILTFLDIFNQRITSPVALPLWVPTAQNRTLKQTLTTIDEVLQPLIDARKASGEDRGDLLSMLLHAQANDDTGILTDAQVRNEVSNLFAAGYEVTAHSAAFALYLIATHPHVEERLLAELNDVLGSRTLTLQDDLPYLDRVIKESMRLLPVTTVFGREAIQDVTVGGYDISKGSQVLIAPWVLHRRPDIYPDPERFDPDRFTPQHHAQIPKYGYLPFSSGPRICIGNAFAMLQLKATIAGIYQQYRLQALPGYTLKPVFRFNTRPEGGLPLRVMAHPSQIT